MRTQYILALLSSGLATASPLFARQAPAAAAENAVASGAGPGTGVDMVKAILAIMPSSNTCEGAKVPDECRTAEQAAPFISKSYANFSAGETAAVLALMGLESAELKFKHNVVPGVPGQGTANMMSPSFVAEYATSIFGADAVAGKSPVQVLSMVTPDEYNFGSAGWFLTTKCDTGVRDALKTGSDAAWQSYMACVGVSGSDPARLAYWSRAKQAFNL
ncbi:hypothetical protein VTK56DRAFT_10250 [Thermocarpiscus australiensis]